MKIDCKERIYAFRTALKDFDFKKVKKFFAPGEGYLPWRRVAKIATKNLWKNRSRTGVTVGGIGVGVGAIVLLVSFGYGLQEMVTKRIIWPEALRVTEASSGSNKVRLDKEMLEKIEEMEGVIGVAPSVRTAGKIVFGNSRVDAVVLGARADYFELNNMQLLEGEMNKEAMDFLYQGGTVDVEELNQEASQSGQVAGVMDEVVERGDKIEDVYFKLADGEWVPIYEGAKKTSRVLGMAKGSVLTRYKGEMIWGEVYEDKSGEGRVEVDGVGLMGKWIKAEFELYDRADDGVYTVMEGEDGGQKTMEGWVSLEQAQIMDKGQVAVEELLEGGSVLGESSASASLAAMLADSDVVGEDEGEAQEDRLVIRSEGLKKILVSQSLVKAWNLTEKEVLGQKVKVEYLVAGNLLSEGSGRLISQEQEYEITGVFEEGKNPMIYVPLAELESMGISNYSSTRILVEKEGQLSQVRALVTSMGLVTRSVVDTLTQINKLFAVIRFLLGSFGAIALVVALFGMFNTMTVSLLERTREIGVMKSLGTSNLDVVRIFLTEAGILSMLGGLGGIVLGGILGKIVDVLVFNFSGKVNSMFILPLGFVLLLLMLVVSVGLVTGLYPSKRASKISALNALRYE